MKKLYVGVGVLVVLVGAGTLAVSQLKSRAIALFEADFSGLRTAFAKAVHGPIDFDLWSSTLTVENIMLLPANVDEASATRFAKVTATGVSQSGERVTVRRLDIEGFATTIETPAELNVRVRYEAPAIAIEQLSSSAVPASAGNSAVSWARQVLTGLTATSIVVPSLKSVTVSTQPAAAKASAPTFNAPFEQNLTNMRFDDIREGKVAKATVESLRATSQMPPPVGGELVAEARGGYVTNYDLAATLALLDRDAPNSAPGFTTLWRTAGSGPITIKAGQAMSMSMSGIVADGIAIDIAKFHSSSKAVQASAVKPGSRATPLQARAMLEAITGLYESVNLAAVEYKDMSIEAPGMPPTKFGLLRLDGFEKGTLAKLSINGLDGATQHGGKYHLDHFSLERLKLAQIIRIAADAGANPAAAQPSQVGWAMLQTLGGLRLDGLTVPTADLPGASTRIDTLRVSWGDFLGSMPMSGQVTLKAQVPVGPRGQEPIATLAKLGVRNPAIAFDGKWKWNEAAQSAEIGPIAAEIAEVGAATLSFTIGNIPRTVLDGGPMMLAIAMPQFKLDSIALEVKDLGLIRLVGTDTTAAAQLEQGIEDLRSNMAALPPEKAEQRALLEAVLKFLTVPGSRLSVAVKPKGDVGIGALLAATQPAQQLLDFITEQMSTTATVAP